MTLQISGSGAITGITSLNTDVSSTELGYLNGVTSNLQTQLNSAGLIKQLVSARETGNPATTTNSYTDIAGLTVSITPASSSNKILIISNISLAVNSSISLNYINLVRNSSEIETAENSVATAGNSFNMTIVNLDSPSTTSSVTYKSQFRTTAGTFTIYNSSITAMEISA